MKHTDGFNDLIHMEIDKAKALAKKEGFTLRVTATNGQYHIGTADYRLDRINVHVVDGRISTIIGIG